MELDQNMKFFLKAFFNFMFYIVILIVAFKAFSLLI
jgi:hypothetical protein